MMIVGLLLLGFLLLVWIIVKLTANRNTRVSETWGCGLPSQNSRMEYTASGFSEPILTIFRPIYRTLKKSNRQYFDTRQAIFQKGEAEIHTFKLFEEKIYLPVANFVRRLSVFIANLQDVDLDVYILYSFITVIILLIVMGWAV